MRQPILVPSFLATVICLAVCAPANAETVNGTFKYKDMSSGQDTLRPIPHAKVEIWRYRPRFLGIWGWDHDKNAYTDDNGRISAHLDYATNDVTVGLRVFTENYAAAVVPTATLGGAVGEAFWMPPGDDNEITKKVHSDSDVLDFSYDFTNEASAAKFNIIETVRQGFNYAASVRDPNAGDPLRTAEVQIGSYLSPVSWYNPVHNVIELEESKVWSDSTILHEYGHFVEENISSFAWIPSTHGGCLTGSGDLAGYDNSEAHAWMEGFADYFAGVVFLFAPQGALGTHTGSGTPTPYGMEIADTSTCPPASWPPQKLKDFVNTVYPEPPGPCGPPLTCTDQFAEVRADRLTITGDEVENYAAGVLWDLTDRPAWNIASSPNGFTNSGGLVKVTTTTPHAFSTGDEVQVRDAPAYNGASRITVVDSTSFTLNGSVFVVATGGGTVGWPSDPDSVLEPSDTLERYHRQIFEIFDRELDVFGKSPTMGDFRKAWVDRGLPTEADAIFRTFSIPLTSAPGAPPDLTPPVVTCETSDGVWHASNVAATCTAEDSDSGLYRDEDARFELRTTVPDNVETDGATTDSRPVCDRVGNCVDAGPITDWKIDRKDPVVEIAQPQARDYVSASTITLDYSSWDGGSGVSTVTPSLDGAATVGGHGLTDGQPIDVLTELSLGTHTFAFSATDKVGNRSERGVTFRVIVTADSIKDDVVQFVGRNEITGLGSSLQSKLSAAANAHRRGQCKTAANQYKAFTHEIQAQARKKISARAAAILVRDANYLVLQCP